MTEQRRLAPGRIAQSLFGIDPDRDERAPQLCAETLLVLSENGYRAPANPKDLRSPKRQRFAVRSLALAENFLGGRDSGRAGDDDMTPQLYGERLAAGLAIRNSANLDLAQAALEGLVDPDTQRGQRGAWLLRPFHESLLWYDARKVNAGRADWSVRKVYMRGSGIIIARLLLDPMDPQAAEQGRRAVAAIQTALTARTPLSLVSNRLESALPRNESYTEPPDLEADEYQAWLRGGEEQLQPLATKLCHHAEGIMLQEGASGPARLWQLRTILALDLAVHALRTAWDTTETPGGERYLLLSFGDGPRARDRVRQQSEESFRRARLRLSEATVSALANTMHALAKEGDVDWGGEFEKRSKLGLGQPNSVSQQLGALDAASPYSEFHRLAVMAVESANYGRAEDGFRVLFESVGLLSGTRYRYLTATPDLLAALVGALSANMPMSSSEFFAAVHREWGLVINQASAAETGLTALLDGSELERNGRRAEQLMSGAGLALGLSDRTTVVGERASRSAC